MDRHGVSNVTISDIAALTQLQVLLRRIMLRSGMSDASASVIENSPCGRR